MSTASLKKDLHLLVDQTENESLLRLMFDLLQQANDPKSADFWSTLTENQKNEILQSAAEADNDEKLIPWEVLVTKY